MRVSSTSGRAFEATASGEALSASDLTVFDAALFEDDLGDEDLGDEGLGNTDAVRDDFLSLYRTRRIPAAANGLYYACRREGFNIPVVRRPHVSRPRFSMFHLRSAALSRTNSTSFR